MQKIVPQSAKLCISFYNLKALCQQTSWLTHVANDHDVIDLLSCNAILDHFQTSSFYSTVIIRAWFFASNKIKLPQNVTFSPMQTRCSSPMKTMREFKYLAFFNIFLKNRDRKKKKLFWTQNNEKTKERLCEIYQNLLKPSWSRIAKQRRVAYVLSFIFCYRTILKLIVKSSLL